MAAGFRFVPKWVVLTLPFELLVVATAVCLAQTVGDSHVVPYRDNAAQSPAPDDVPKSYGPVEAGQDAYQWAEQERRQAIARQLQIEDAVAWRHSPARYSYAYYPPVSAVYMRGGPRAYRYAYRPAYVYPRSAPLGWFESWPLVAGEIHGYPYLYRIPQPWGHQVIVIGPRSYLVRPLYKVAPWVEEMPEPVSAPPAIEPAPSPPAPSAPGDGGPREF